MGSHGPDAFVKFKASVTLKKRKKELFRPTAKDKPRKPLMKPISIGVLAQIITNRSIKRSTVK